jgi:SPX domain protein involved in polyphosphate accumulation|tara:strand:+ start:4239 stop:4892 length:654 start_codon:yes stop_codon:yes gene_type:complete
VTSLKRYERKWVFKNTDKNIILQNLIDSKLFFRFQYDSRFVNSIYFDRNNLQNAQDNIDGISDREKIRLRWYGANSSFINKPILEKKIRNNFLGSKDYFNLNNYKNTKLTSKNLSLLTKKVNTTIGRNDLIPITLVSYKREYLVSGDNNIRATVDINIKYKILKNLIQNFFIKSNDVVLELKYDANFDPFIRTYLSGIKRIMKNSKYVNSLFSTYGI